RAATATMPRLAMEIATMTTLRRRESSARNGARSKGPKSDTGKLQSRRSALKGGFTAKVVLPAEVEAEAARLADELETTFRARDAWERHLVRDVLAVGMVQLQRHDRRVHEAESEQIERAT